jgi:hypothetical protein
MTEPMSTPTTNFDCMVDRLMKAANEAIRVTAVTSQVIYPSETLRADAAQVNRMLAEAYEKLDQWYRDSEKAGASEFLGPPR